MLVFILCDMFSWRSFMSSHPQMTNLGIYIAGHIPWNLEITASDPCFGVLLWTTEFRKLLEI